MGRRGTSAAVRQGTARVCRRRPDPAARVPPFRFPVLLGAMVIGPGAGRADAQIPSFHTGVPTASPATLCVVPDSVGRQLERVARRRVGESLGVSAIHLETGARVSLNGARRFPMASVSKIPMVMEFLRRVDAGEIRLDETLTIPPTDFRAGHSPLAEWSGGRPVRATLNSLLRLTIAVSDNTATDVILRMAGGPATVTRGVRALGIDGIDVDRSEARTFADLSGIPDSVPESELYRYGYFRMRDALPPEHRQAARLRFGDDPRDTATPDAMADLLAELYRGAGLSEASRGLLLDYMTISRSGPRRLKGLLPAGTPVAHKTGTLAGAINDVGIVTLPGGAGHLAIAVFVNTLHRSTWRRERAIAEVSRLLHDYFASAWDPTARGAGAGPCR